jgi:hypothetical protein
MCEIIKNSRLKGRSSSLVGYGIGIAEVVGSNPTRSIAFLYVFLVPSINIVKNAASLTTSKQS